MSCILIARICVNYLVKWSIFQCLNLLIGRTQAVARTFCNLIKCARSWKVLTNIHEVISVQPFVIVHVVCARSADTRYLRVLILLFSE